jgi:nitroreductase/Pyruvate/2-oxoacid:ferredoxin oxidoreductase delta subunit
MESKMVQNYFDLAKCDRCAICMAVCPVRIIAMDEKTRYPSVSETSVPACVRCGHCEAVCPRNAIQINHEKLLLVPEFTVSEKLTPKQIKAYFMSRRSIRAYQKEPVKKAVIEEVMDIVRYAPTGVNRQPVKWIVVHSPDTVKQLANAVINWMREAVDQKLPLAGQLNFAGLVRSWDKGNDPICRNAPHLVIAYYRKDDRMAAGDATIALTHLELIAPAFGLGACWAGYLGIASSASRELKNVIELPQDHVVSGALMLGYPKYRFVRVPKRNAVDVVWR